MRRYRSIALNKINFGRLLGKGKNGKKKKKKIRVKI
jgi:hypothetical protein